MKGVTAQSCQVYKVGGEVERNMYGVSGKFKSSFYHGGPELFVATMGLLSSRLPWDCNLLHYRRRLHHDHRYYQHHLHIFLSGYWIRILRSFN